MPLLPVIPRGHLFPTFVELVNREKPVYISTGMMADAKRLLYLLDYETAKAVSNKDQRSSHISTEPTVDGD